MGWWHEGGSSAVSPSKDAAWASGFSFCCGGVEGWTLWLKEPSRKLKGPVRIIKQP